MDHFKPYQPRKIIKIPIVEANGWQLKRYAVFAKNKSLDEEVVSSASDAAIERLPDAGNLTDPDGNHGVGFQIIHFAEVAVVSPVFYWVWGSVLANTEQMRAQWDDSMNFESGVKEVVGCVWEMQIICFETQSWMTAMLGEEGPPTEKLSRYLENCFPSAENP